MAARMRLAAHGWGRGEGGCKRAPEASGFGCLSRRCLGWSCLTTDYAGLGGRGGSAGRQGCSWGWEHSGCSCHSLGGRNNALFGWRLLCDRPSGARGPRGWGDQLQRTFARQQRRRASCQEMGAMRLSLGVAGSQRGRASITGGDRRRCMAVDACAGGERSLGELNAQGYYTTLNTNTLPVAWPGQRHGEASTTGTLRCHSTHQHMQAPGRRRCSQRRAAPPAQITAGELVQLLLAITRQGASAPLQSYYSCVRHGGPEAPPAGWLLDGASPRLPRPQAAPQRRHIAP